MRSKWAIPSRKTCPQRQLKRTQDMLHVSYSQSQLSNKYYPCTLNDQLSITQKSPCLFRLNVIVRKQELIAVQEETQYSQEFSSYLQGLVLFCSRHAKFQRNQQNPKPFKAKDFSVKTICLKRVLLLVTQDQPAFLGVHLLVMYHLMWWLTNH